MKTEINLPDFLVANVRIIYFRRGGSEIVDTVFERGKHIEPMQAEKWGRAWKTKSPMLRSSALSLKIQNKMLTSNNSVLTFIAHTTHSSTKSTSKLYFRYQWPNNNNSQYVSAVINNIRKQRKWTKIWLNQSWKEKLKT